MKNKNDEKKKKIKELNTFIKEFDQTKRRRSRKSQRRETRVWEERVGVFVKDRIVGRREEVEVGWVWKEFGRDEIEEGWRFGEGEERQANRRTRVVEVVVDRRKLRKRELVQIVSRAIG